MTSRMLFFFFKILQERKSTLTKVVLSVNGKKRAVRKVVLSIKCLRNTEFKHSVIFSISVMHSTADEK